MSTIGVGIIGTGDRGCFVLGTRILELFAETHLEIKALCDVNPARLQDAQAYLKKIAQDQHASFAPNLYNHYKDLIDDPKVELILITNHTYAHKEPALSALTSGKKVYLDKPISVTLDDATQIIETEYQTQNPLLMGFTRRYEPSWLKAYELVQQGTIGKLQMILVRSVIPYSRYLQLWHRKKELSGGALNDKSSHHMDVFNWFAGAECSFLTAIGGRSDVFKPDPTAPDYCAICDRDCPYRRSSDGTLDAEGGHVLGYPSWSQARLEIDRADTCVFKPGADIEDHAIVSMEFANGVKGSLFWTIFGPHAQDQETLELVGSSGRLILTRSTGQIDVIGNYGKKRELLDTRNKDFASSHYGADLQLIRTMAAFFHGETPSVTAYDGYKSLEMVLASQESMANHGKPIAFTSNIKNQYTVAKQDLSANQIGKGVLP